jgi:hypothetical protein
VQGIHAHECGYTSQRAEGSTRKTCFSCELRIES